MDEKLNEKIQEFLRNFINPEEDDIKDFVDSLAAEYPSVNTEELRDMISERSETHMQQSAQLYKFDEEFSEFSDNDSPEVNEFRQLLQTAYDMNSKLTDVSDEIERLKAILADLKKQSTPAEDIQEEAAPDIDNLLGRIQELKSKGQKTPAGDIETGSGSEDISEVDTTPNDDRIATADLMDRLKTGKDELTEMLEEKVESQERAGAVEIPEKGDESERQLVRDFMEEKLVSDVEARIKTIKQKQELAMEEKEKVPLGTRIRNYFAKDIEELEEYNPDIHGPLVTFEGLENHEEIERYWVNEPYAFVVVLNNLETNEKLYYVVEPRLSRFEDTFLREIKDRLRNVLLVEDIIPEEDKESVLTNKVKQIIRDYAIELTPVMLEKILYYVIRDFVNFGPIDAVQRDNRIEDLSCNGHNVPIYLYHKQYLNIATNVVFHEDELDSFIIRLAQRSGKHISVAEPMIDATMPDGSRIQMTLSTHVTARGGTFTIRKFSDVPLTPIDLINWKTFNSEAMAYLWLCIENNKSLIFAGGTASGKTSSLNAVALFIPRQAKVITLEDTRELKLPHPNWIPSVTRDAFTADERGAVDMYELLRAALRQRPEYLLVGEVRGKEALTLFQAMSTGHTTFSTMHADSVASAIHRLENPPISVPRSMIQALNIISIQSQTYSKGKRVRRNLKLVEITDIDPQTRNIRTNDIFTWDSMTDTFQRVGESKALNDIMTRRAWTPQELKKELLMRQKILDFFSRNNITDYNAVSTIIYDYSINPERVLKKLKLIE